MTALFKLTIGCLLFSFIGLITLSSNPSEVYISSEVSNSLDVNPIQLSAYQILNEKCNTCHIKKNRRRIFSLQNMDSWAKDIYKQVFVNKRMPKGREVRLTWQEYEGLKEWIESVKIER